MRTRFFALISGFAIFIALGAALAGCGDDDYGRDLGYGTGSDGGADAGVADLTIVHD